MTIQMTATRTPTRRLLRSAAAVLGGLIAVVVLSTATDMVLHATGIYPPPLQPMADPLWVLAIAYRVVYGIAGGYLAARLAPDRPMAHAVVLGVVGTLLSIAGAAATWGGGPEFGPAWYAFGLVLTALPSCWLGGILHRKRHAKR